MASTCMVVERRRPGKGGGGTWRRIGKAVVGTHAIIHGHGPAAPHHRDAPPALAAGARASWNMGKSDVDGIFDPPYYEWFQFDKVLHPPPSPLPPVFPLPDLYYEWSVIQI
ncbi:hypothetical protein ZWY2020_010307 [Hordeum vulgare]|nr:hypothetical protein ZWY2020_010307 [Hordeum vulgare]